MLEAVAITLTELIDKCDDLRCCVRDFDRVGLDVSDRETSFLNGVLKIHHEECATFSDDVVDVTRISERVLISSICLTVDSINSRLQAISQILRGEFAVLNSLGILHELAAQNIFDSIPVLMLDVYSTLHDVSESSSIVNTEDYLSDCTMRMHRGNIKKGYVLVNAWLSVDMTTLTDFFATVS